MLDYQLSETTKLKKVELNEEHKKLFMFPPSSKFVDNKSKEPLPLKAECEILSDDLRKLK